MIDIKLHAKQKSREAIGREITADDVLQGKLVSKQLLGKRLSDHRKGGHQIAWLGDLFAAVRKDEQGLHVMTVYRPTARQAQIAQQCRGQTVGKWLS